MTAFLSWFESSIKEYRFKVWNVNKTNGKEVRPWPDWPDQLLWPCYYIGYSKKPQKGVKKNTYNTIWCAIISLLACSAHPNVQHTYF